MLLLLLACFDSADTQPTARVLDGEWTFAEECGESAGGTPVAVYYSLTITGLTATLHADGYQTMTRLNADLVVVSPESWRLDFTSADPDSMFPDAYKKGEPLLSLTPSGEALKGQPMALVLNCSEGMVFTR